MGCQGDANGGSDSESHFAGNGRVERANLRKSVAICKSGLHSFQDALRCWSGRSSAVGLALREVVAIGRFGVREAIF